MFAESLLTSEQKLALMQKEKEEFDVRIEEMTASFRSLREDLMAAQEEFIDTFRDIPATAHIVNDFITSVTSTPH